VRGRVPEDGVTLSAQVLHPPPSNAPVMTTPASAPSIVLLSHVRCLIRHTPWTTLTLPHP
jgi:hypothetical protein